MHRRKKIISAFAVLSFSIFITVMFLYCLSSESVLVADYLNSTVCHAFRRGMASFGDLFPFSLLELIVLTLPLTVGILVAVAVRRFSRGEGRVRFIINLASFILLLYSGHVMALGIAYKTTPIAEKMSMPAVEVTADRLSDVMIDLRDEVNALADRVPRDENGVFESGKSFDELSALICESYSKLSEKYGLPENYSSRAKGVYHGNLMSYLEITGVYSYFTGEANVNTAYPDYDLIFTTAHEMSHQRGILRENEANFLAYLLCMTSDDPALRYSGALSMYEYTSSALYRTDPERYEEIAEGLSDAPRADMAKSREIYQKYSNTLVGDISNKINDIFLKSNGTEGVVSYSKVVELVVAYHELGN